MRRVERAPSVVMTAAVKEELSGLRLPTLCCRRAEVAALVRFAGGLHVVGGRVVVAAELEAGALARRLRMSIGGMYGYPCEVRVLPSAGVRRGARYLVRVLSDGPALAGRLGLLDSVGRPVWGLAGPAGTGRICDAAAVWRGAFLAQGSLTEPGRAPALEVRCPGSEAATGLVGAARRLGVTARTREVDGAHRVVVRDGAAIGVLLSAMGAPRVRARWQARRLRRQDLRGAGNRLAVFDEANLRRIEHAAGAAAARVSRALHILGDQAPDHLAAAGALRLHHRHASLGELARLADPPLSKDTLASRIRRLVALADRVAHERGIPDTTTTTTTATAATCDL